MTGVVIVNWNGRRLLDACLEAVFAQTAPPELAFLVDNGSTDGPAHHLRQQLPARRTSPPEPTPRGAARDTPRQPAQPGRGRSHWEARPQRAGDGSAQAGRSRGSLDVDGRRGA